MRTYEEDPCGGENINIHSQEEEEEEEEEALDIDIEEEEEDNSSILSEHFSQLSSMLPGLQQDTIIDQDDIIKIAIEHIEKLRHDQANIQEQVNRSNAIRSSVDNAVSTTYMPGSSSGEENNGIPILKVICKGNSVIIQIHCKTEKGNMSRITNEIDKFNLSIVNMNSFPFEDHIDITFIAKVRDGLRVNLKEFVSTLEVLLSD